MLAATLHHSAESFVDPRLEADFQSALWPAVGGCRLPAWPEADPHERRCLEFLAACYRVNVCRARWLAACGEPTDTGAVEPKARQLVAAMAALENLEDRYAPVGFLGDPRMADGFYREVIFVRPALPRVGSAPSSSSSHLAIPGLEFLPARELRGAIRVVRRSHGKVDL